MDTIDRIIDLSNKNNINGKELGVLLGLKKSPITDWKNEKSKPTLAQIKSLCEIFAVSSDYLIFGTDIQTQPTLSKENSTILKKYNSISAEQKQVINYLLEQFTYISNTKIDTEFSEIIDLKLFTQKASAGLGNYFALDDNEYTVKSFNIVDVPKGAEFCIIADGDSMLPTIKDQQILFVKPTPSINNNEIGIFIIDGEVFCKKLIIDSQSNAVFLRSINSKYPDIPIKEFNNIKTVGKVLL